MCVYVTQDMISGDFWRFPEISSQFQHEGMTIYLYQRYVMQESLTQGGGKQKFLPEGGGRVCARARAR